MTEDIEIEESGEAVGAEVEPPLARQAQGKSRKPLFALVGGIGLVILIVSGLWLGYRPVQDQIEGMVDAREIRAASKVTGRIEAFHVSEGARVTAGQLLFTVDSPEVVARSQQANGAVTAARAMEAKAEDGARAEDIRAAEAQWRRAKAAADLAGATHQRIQRLFNEGVVPGQQRDEAEANAVASKEAERAARAVYDQALAGARDEDKLAASGQLEQALGAFAEVEAAAAETRIASPADGEVGRRLAQVGELVPQGFPVFMVTETGDPWVTIFVREDQFSDLRRAAVYKGTIPALGDKEAEFQVTFIAPAGNFATWRATRQSSGYDVKSFEVHLKPTEPIERLRPGMTVLFPWPQRSEP
ncbi:MULTISPECIES: HlyD family secretion protein [Hyphomonadaceae]|uniref:HlyD family secretion protein n=1 Tax=Hyphomonadaceae TaxID=69657 RepID=UPI000A0435E3|nr:MULTISPECIES: efflux RND transporter periplasmic adaptor subunit [Hyphomonadaceae]OUX96342.1 MAG: hemolysin secretion protein D [Hyphomonadaceae bacterium TMED5]|tara:strand:+ start:9706 stop:10782 length:1077 start_codon:yes stop_codon:yes gene_type:complete